MNQDFKLKFDEYKDNDPTEKTGSDSNNPDYYPSAGNTRNIAFIFADGRMQFFNYSYLVTCAYNQDDSKITLEFSTHTIVLKGQKLEQLFFELMAQANKVIRCIDSRYQSLETTNKSMVGEISIATKM